MTNKQVLNLFAKWQKAVKEHDIDKIVKLYSKDAVLLPTMSNRILKTHEDIRDYFIHFFKLNPKVEINDYVIHLCIGLAVNSGCYTFSVTQAKTKYKIRARFTFVYKRYNRRWLIIEQHSSRMPDSE